MHLILSGIWSPPQILERQFVRDNHFAGTMQSVGVSLSLGRQNPFLQYRRYTLSDVVQSQIPAARFSLNNRQVGLQVIRFGTNP